MYAGKQKNPSKLSFISISLEYFSGLSFNLCSLPKTQYVEISKMFSAVFVEISKMFLAVFVGISKMFGIKRD